MSAIRRRGDLRARLLRFGGLGARFFEGAARAAFLDRPGSALRERFLDAAFAAHAAFGRT